MGEFDIKSSTLDKGLEVAKNFIDKLVMPSVEEPGLLIKDQITNWRFKNQVKILNKAELYCQKHNIHSKKISLKLLTPLLEYSSLEEDNELQDKWAILLSNLVDSEQNIENHVFPYILSQLSKDEFFSLESIYDKRIKRFSDLQEDLKIFIKESNLKKEELKIKIIELDKVIVSENKKKYRTVKLDKLLNEKSNIKRELESFPNIILSKRINIYKKETIPEELFHEFEFSNLIRLALVKEIKDFYADTHTLEIPAENHYDSYNYVDVDITVDSHTEYILTELGELFFKACKEKNQNS